MKVIYCIQTEEVIKAFTDQEWLFLNDEKKQRVLPGEDSPLYPYGVLDIEEVAANSDEIGDLWRNSRKKNENGVGKFKVKTGKVEKVKPWKEEEDEA
jgi:methionine synthase II (cobalamin-independent)